MCIFVLPVPNIPFYSHPFITSEVFRKWRNQKSNISSESSRTLRELLVNPYFICVVRWYQLAACWRSRCCSVAPKACRSFSGFCQDRVRRWPWQVDCRRDLMLPGAWIFHLEARCCSKSRSQRSSSQGGGLMKQDACCSSEVTRDPF